MPELTQQLQVRLKATGLTGKRLSEMLGRCPAWYSQAVRRKHVSKLVMDELLAVLDAVERGEVVHRASRSAKAAIKVARSHGLQGQEIYDVTLLLLRQLSPSARQTLMDAAAQLDAIGTPNE